MVCANSRTAAFDVLVAANSPMSASVPFAATTMAAICASLSAAALVAAGSGVGAQAPSSPANSTTDSSLVLVIPTLLEVLEGKMVGKGNYVNDFFDLVEFGRRRWYFSGKEELDGQTLARQNAGKYAR